MSIETVRQPHQHYDRGYAKRTYRKCEKCCPIGVHKLCATCAASDMSSPVCVGCAFINRSCFPYNLNEHEQQHSDLLGFCIDRGVLALVEALNKAGYATFDSCSGACDGCYGHPYIGMVDINTATCLMAAARTYKKLADDYVLGDLDMFDDWQIEVKVLGGPPCNTIIFFSLPMDHAEFLIEVVGLTSYAEARLLLRPTASCWA